MRCGRGWGTSHSGGGGQGAGGARPWARICVHFWILNEATVLWLSPRSTVACGGEWGHRRVDTLGLHWSPGRGGKFLCRGGGSLDPSGGGGQTVLKVSAGSGCRCDWEGCCVCVRGPAGIRCVGTLRYTKRDCPGWSASVSVTVSASGGGGSGVTAPRTSYGSRAAPVHARGSVGEASHLGGSRAAVSAERRTEDCVRGSSP